MKLSKPQQRALIRGRFGLTVTEINANGNWRRTYLSLQKKGLLDWADYGLYWRMEPTEEGKELLKEMGRL